MAELRQIVDLRQSPTALRVQRGVMRFLRAAHDFCCYAEVPLANGRRGEQVTVFNDDVRGAISMTSLLIDTP